MAGIELRDVTKDFPDGTRAVASLPLSIPDGPVMALVGPAARPRRCG
jgi:ABC-type sugar transport system ATPase subunit